jgi:hypothetical protein
VQKLKRNNEIRVRHLRISHPDPNRTEAFHDGKGAHARRGGYWTMRIVHALALGVEPQAVVRALDRAAVRFSAMQGSKSMGTAVLQCDWALTFVAKHHDRLI